MKEVGEMVDISIILVDGGRKFKAWNFSRPFGLGSPGDTIDIMLAQYIVFRWSKITVSAGVVLTTSDIDGKWGPRSDRAFESLLRATTAANEGVVDDGRFDRFPPGTSGSFGSGKLFKVIMLQKIYASLDPSDLRDNEDIILDMPDDGQCPPLLAAALRDIKTNSGVAPSNNVPDTGTTEVAVGEV